MNNTMIEHHTKQMEARRKEFNELWLGEITTALEELGGVNNRVLAGVRHVCWMAYRAGDARERQHKRHGHETMKRPKTSRQIRDAQPRSLHVVVGGKGLVHAIANCLVCDWECLDYLTAQRKAEEHARTKGHKVSVELAYAITYSSNDQPEPLPFIYDPTGTCCIHIGCTGLSDNDWRLV